MAQGIEVRKRRNRTVYRAVVYDKRTDRKLSKTFDTLQAAKQWRADAQSALTHGRMTANRGPTLKDAVEQWLAGARAGHVRNRSGDPYKPAAIRGYEKDLRLRVLPTLGDVRLAEIRHRDVQALVDKLVENGHAPTTVQGAITPLRAIYRRALTRGIVNENPTRGIELPAIRSRPRRFCSPGEVEAILAGLEPAARAMWATAFYAGLRRGELTGLAWDDVDLAAGVIHVRRGWDACEGEIAPKSRQGRRKVPVPAALRDYLVEHRMTSTGARVFGTAWDVRQHADQVDTLALHEARHSYASLMIAAKVNAKALSTFMGHANIGITVDLYGHLLPGSEGEAADLLDAYLASETSPITSPDQARAAA